MDANDAIIHRNVHRNGKVYKPFDFALPFGILCKSKFSSVLQHSDIFQSCFSIPERICFHSFCFVVFSQGILIKRQEQSTKLFLSKSVALFFPSMLFSTTYINLQ